MEHEGTIPVPPTQQIKLNWIAFSTKTSKNKEKVNSLKMQKNQKRRRKWKS